MAKVYTLEDALYLMARLRDPKDGCPWDIKQTMQDITHYTIEECYELVDAIAQGDKQHTEEELGDVLFQVIFYAQIAKESGDFDFASIVDKLVTKLVRRHPHVFPQADLYQRFGYQPNETDEIKSAWEAIKSEERAAKQKSGLLDDVPNALPALSRAQKLQKRAASVGMDWSNVDAVIEMLKSEVKELENAIHKQDAANIEEEVGDVLFSAVNVARTLKLDSEKSLRQANDKFKLRIECMEQLAERDSISLADCSEAQLDRFWQQAKRKLQTS